MTTKNQYAVECDIESIKDNIIRVHHHTKIYKAKSFMGVVRQINSKYNQYGNLSITRIGEGL